MGNFLHIDETQISYFNFFFLICIELAHSNQNIYVLWRSEPVFSTFTAVIIINFLLISPQLLFLKKLGHFGGHFGGLGKADESILLQTVFDCIKSLNSCLLFILTIDLRKLFWITFKLQPTIKLTIQNLNFMKHKENK